MGKVSSQDIEAWGRSFQQCRDRNCFGEGFKLLVNTFGYEPESVEVHQKWRSALVSYCENRCIAIAFVNHDSHQVSELKRMASSTHNFFDDIDEAYEWLQDSP